MSSVHRVQCVHRYSLFPTTEGRLNHQEFFSTDFFLQTDRQTYRPPYRSFEPKLKNSILEDLLSEILAERIAVNGHI